MRLELREPALDPRPRGSNTNSRVPAHPPRRDAWWIGEVPAQQERSALGASRPRRTGPGRTRSATSGATSVIEWYAPTRAALTAPPRERVSRSGLGSPCIMTPPCGVVAETSAPRWTGAASRPRGTPAATGARCSAPRSAFDPAEGREDGRAGVVMHGMPARAGGRADAATRRCAGRDRTACSIDRGRPRRPGSDRPPSVRPSETFATARDRRCRRVRAPRPCRASPAGGTRDRPDAWPGTRSTRLSRFATETNTVPSRGSAAPLATRALAQRASRIGVDPHDLARRLHLGPEHRVRRPGTVRTAGRPPSQRCAAACR